MLRRLLGVWAVIAIVLTQPVVAAPKAALTGRTRNVVLIVCDGVRWQEVFTGADPTLLNEESGGSWTPISELRSRYWNDSVESRRALLMPFLWGTIARDGVIFGNQGKGSVAQVTNPMWFSYPGYNEMSVGVADPNIDSNEFGPNPNRTVFEWLNTLPDLHGQVEIFGTWSVFHDIFNEGRSQLPVRSGKTLVDEKDRSVAGVQLKELYETTSRLEGDDPYDSFLHIALREHLKKHHPRVLFVGFGDTDNFAHMGRYDLLLQGMHSVDQFVADLWRQMQSLPQYRNKTTFIITTDHGRGGGLVDWKEHGTEQAGSENVWIAVMGPDTPALGERTQTAAVTQAQIAASVAAAVGKDYRAVRSQVAPVLPDIYHGSH